MCQRIHQAFHFGISHAVVIETHQQERGIHAYSRYQRDRKTLTTVLCAECARRGMRLWLEFLAI